VSPGARVDELLPPEPAAVRAARRAVSDVARQVVGDDDLDGVLLATSEVVTNAVEHGAPPIELHVECVEHHLRVEVRDASPLPPRRREDQPSPAEVRGRGMVIVERCTNRWGVEEAADGKSVWFEVDL
jgi:anti-sigma regulatory factor (Ser/Thr protein kinase)